MPPAKEGRMVTGLVVAALVILFLSSAIRVVREYERG